METGIEFKLCFEGGEIIYKSSDAIKEIISSQIVLGNIKANLYMNAKDKGCASLLKFAIENKYKELALYKQNILVKLLNGEDFVLEEIQENLPFIYKNNNMLLLKLKNNYKEALNIIQNLYTKEEIFCFIYENYIVIIGNFDELIEHAEGIKNSVEMELYCNCIISVAKNITDECSFRKSYKEAKEAIYLGEVFSLGNTILSYDDLFLERLAYNIDSRVKDDILRKLNEVLQKFDREMINTIDKFVRCNLNISEAAKALYIHRNTLIYRLDKVHRETGYDIRIFRDAALLAIALLCWKEKIGSNKLFP